MHRRTPFVAFAVTLLGLSWLALLSGCGSRPAGLPKLATVTDITSRPNAKGPRVLCVIAHPDDETAFAATMYKTTTFLDGIVDVLLLTNGEGGYKYATLSEPIYRMALTEPSVGRRHLPRIRRREQVAGLKILGARRLIGLAQKDHRYTRNPREVLAPDAGVWDLAKVRSSIAGMLAETRYDYVFVFLPVPSTHGHHQAATILTLEMIARLPVLERPIVLGAGASDDDLPFVALDGFPITKLREGAPPLVFDRTQKFGHKARLDYRIIVNWLIAEHKSQGTMQLAMNRGERERFFLFDVSPPGAEAKARAYFDALHRPQFPTRAYSSADGVGADKPDETHAH